MGIMQLIGNLTGSAKPVSAARVETLEDKIARSQELGAQIDELRAQRKQLKQEIDFLLEVRNRAALNNGEPRATMSGNF
jgi:cell division protein FtsB